MAQLRDARTSELLGEGTPTEMVLLAEQIGRSDVLFDGVTSEHNPDGFDPDAVLEAHQERVQGLQDAIAAEADPDAKARLEDAVQDAVATEEAAKAQAEDARDLMQAVRERAGVA